MTTFDAVYDAMDDGQRKAVIRKVALSLNGDESIAVQVIDDVLSGDLKIVLVDASKTLVDQRGRCIPPSGLSKSQVVDANPQRRLVQPEIDYGTVIERLMKFLKIPQKRFISVVEFEARVKALIVELGEHKQLKNLLCGVWLPIVLPKRTIANYVRALEEIFLPAVERSYMAQFPGRKFYNHRQGDWSPACAIAVTNRHRQLISAMRKGPVVCIYFPTAFQGFGIDADRQTIEQFPQGFALAGAIDIATAMVAYPDTLARDGNTPVLDAAANIWPGPDCSLCFRSNDSSLDFSFRRLRPHGNFSGGVLFFG